MAKKMSSSRPSTKSGHSDAQARANAFKHLCTDVFAIVGFAVLKHQHPQRALKKDRLGETGQPGRSSLYSSRTRCVGAGCVDTKGEVYGGGGDWFCLLGAGGTAGAAR